jgi:hypothetical protein
LGVDGNNFFRNSVVVPQTFTITGLVLSVRDNTAANRFPVTGQIWLSRQSTSCTSNPSPVGTAVTIPLGSCCGFAEQNISVSRCDLLSVQVTTSDGALTDGAAATIILSSV